MIEDHTKESEEIASVKAEQAAAKSSRPIMRVKVYSPYHLLRRRQLQYLGSKCYRTV